MLKKITLTAVLVASFGVSAVYADMVALDKDTQGDGNKGLSYRPWMNQAQTEMADFIITARSSIDETSPADGNASGEAGTVYIDKDKKKGAGVQTADGGGSKGISGGGGHKDEELIFTYDQNVYLNSIDLLLRDIEFGKGLGNKDDPMIYLKLAGSSSFDFTISEADIFAAYSPIGKSKDKYGMVDFDSFTSIAGLSDDTLISALAVRETNDHIYVSGVSTGIEVVPEPATMCLLLAGGVGLVIKRRRKVKTQA